MVGATEEVLGRPRVDGHVISLKRTAAISPLTNSEGENPVRSGPGIVKLTSCSCEKQFFGVYKSQHV